MEHITVAGCADAVPVSARAAQHLQEQLTRRRDERGDEAADALERLVGERISSELAAGAPSIDLGTMIAIVSCAELPREVEPEPTGLGKVIQDLKDRAAQRGYGHLG